MELMYKCPKCGKEMLKGSLLAGYGRKLLWYPGHRRYSLKDDIKTFFYRGDPESVMLLHRYTEGARYLPALNCPDCKLVLLDYDEEHALREN